MNNLIPMNYNGTEIRTIDDNGQIWWVLTDICKVLSISNPSKVANRLDEDERSNFRLGRQGNCIIINESGLYSVILRSDKPEAKSFRRWVTHDVLPQIRQNGCYSIEPKNKTKTWYGMPVLTIKDAAELLQTDRSNARKKIMSQMRNGLDFFVLTGYYLQLFKHENRSISETTAQLILIRRDEFLKQFNN